MTSDERKAMNTPAILTFRNTVRSDAVWPHLTGTSDAVRFRSMGILPMSGRVTGTQGRDDRAAGNPTHGQDAHATRRLIA